MSPPPSWHCKRGCSSAAQVDIVETLLRPLDVVPGYEILDCLGHGGMGVVYRARQRNLDRIVALKTVLVSQMGESGTVQRFEQEALAVARLRHPNVVAAYDFGRHEGRLFFAMELVEGEDLGELIDRSGRLDEHTAWVLARQAAAGLAHAQQQGIVHRDIKPANLLLVSPPEGFALPPGVPMVKIADFGLAFLTADTETRTRLTAAYNTVGTPHYVAPELLTGTTVDFRADIYSLGATVYHMLTGQPPLAGLGLAQILTHKVSQESPSLADDLPGVSPATAALVAEMMARDPAHRVGSYAQLLQRIDAILPQVAGRAMAPVGPMSGLATPATTDTLAGRTTTKTLRMPAAAASARRRRLLLGVTVMAMLAACAALAWKFWPSGAAAVPPRDMVPAGHGDYLFNGQSIDGWSPRSGQWSMVEDEEGNVISGAGGVFRRMLPRTPGGPSPAYRITASFRLHQAEAAEFHFAIHPATGDNGPRYVLRITAEGAVLGERAGDRGEFVPRLPRLAAPSSRTNFMPCRSSGSTAFGTRCCTARRSSWSAPWKRAVARSRPKSGWPPREPSRRISRTSWSRNSGRRSKIGSWKPPKSRLVRSTRRQGFSQFVTRRDDDFLVGQMIGRKRGGGADVVLRELRVMREDLVVRHALTELSQDQLDSDASPFDDRLAEHDLGINRDALVSHPSILPRRGVR